MSRNTDASRRVLLAFALVLFASLAAAPAAAAIELCDGRDDDADGTLDEGCPRACANPRDDGERLVSEPGTSVRFGRDRVVVWDGAGFGAVWSEPDGIDERIVLARLGPSGRARGPATPLEPSTEAQDDPVLDWSGEVYGVAYARGNFGLADLIYAAVDPDGSVVAGPIKIDEESAEAARPAIVWDGGAFAVAWARYNGQIRFRRVLPDGTRLGVETCVTCGISTSVRETSIAAGPDGGFLVAWSDTSGGIHVVATDADGARLADPVTIEDADGADHPSAVWAGTSYAVAWSDRRNREESIYVARFTSAGARDGGDVRVNDAQRDSWQPVLAWTGEELLVAWAGAETIDDAQLFFRRLAPDLTPLAPTLVIEAGEGSRMRTGLAWTGTRPAILRDEFDFAVPRPARLRLIACCGDADGDGVDRCDGDADDTAAGVFPGAPEACNGRDDDLDGTIDEGCERACSGTQLVGEEELGAQPGLDRFGLALRDADGRAFVVRSEERGSPEGERLVLERDAPPWAPRDLEGDPSTSRQPACAADGTGVVTAFADARTGAPALRVAVDDGDGTAVTEDAPLDFAASSDAAPGLAWGGRRHGLVWRRDGGGSEVTFSLLRPNGAPILAARGLGASPGAGGAAAVTLDPDGGVAIARLEDRGASGVAVVLERRDGEGGRRADPAELATPASGRLDPAIVALGDGFVVAWSEPSGGGPSRVTRFVRSDEAGQVLAGPLPLAEGDVPSDRPALAFTGAEVLALYRADGEMRRARLGPDGTRLAPDARVGEEGALERAALAWDGAEARLAWTSSESGCCAVRTAVMTCDEASGEPAVSGLVWVDESTLAWDEVAGATYDVVSGALDALAGGAGVAGSLDACEGAAIPETTLVPGPASLPRYYLVRARLNGVAGSYEPEPAPGAVGGRDAGADASGADCP